MVPLSPSPFNTSKSRLKGIEMMAAGVAWVASPRAEYRRLRRESGCGYLAETPKDWYNRLNQLLKDEPLRKEQVEMGREYMKDQTYEANAWRWAEAWERAYKVQRGVTA
jgi:glycosyltransferase involved in cell wall biosynthesis